MKGGLSGLRGFTILEVMIVLAVTGALFISIATTISGRQRVNQFSQGIQDFKATLEQIISEVGNGYYPDSKNFNCSASGNSISISAATPASPQGTNEGCIFLGKAIQFAVKDTDPQEFRVYTMAALQSDSNGNPVNALSNADPTTVAPTGGGASWSNARTFSMKYGQTVVSISSGVGSVGSVAFLTDLTRTSNIPTATQDINIYPLRGTILNDTSSGAVNDLNNIDTATANPTPPTAICVKSGGTNQSGLLTLGGNGTRTLVTLKIFSNTSCS